jgi:hypothetical protein
MINRIRIAAATTVVFTGLLATATNSPSGAPGPPTQPPAADRIQIEHEYVQIPVEQPAATVQVISSSRRHLSTAPAPARRPSPRSMLARGSSSTVGQEGAPTMLNRAARAFVGSGRFKPQPFPQPVR